MRISDWSSDVCSSDLLGGIDPAGLLVGIDDHVALAGLDRHRDDLVPEAAVGDGLLGAVGALGGISVDVLAAEAVLGAGRVAEYAHGLAVVGIEFGRASCRERVCQYV